jgi:hypothetical protein
MSSLILVGFFGLAQGRRNSATHGVSDKRSYYAYYSTAIRCASPPSVGAELRVYTPPNTTLFADGTVVFAVAKAYVPASGDALLDAASVYHVGGDPCSDTYEENIPNLTCPFVIGLGAVPSNPSTISDGSRVFDVVVSEYVRDSAKVSTIQYVHPIPCLHFR